MAMKGCIEVQRVVNMYERCISAKGHKGVQGDMKGVWRVQRGTEQVQRGMMGCAGVLRWYREVQSGAVEYKEARRDMKSCRGTEGCEDSCRGIFVFPCLSLSAPNNHILRG